MHTHSGAQPAKTVPPVPPNPWKSGTLEWYYDEGMRFIEPDLMLNAIGRLEAFYAGETEAERQQRFVRYEQAFAVFDEAVGSAGAEMEGKLREMRKEKHGQATHEQQQKEERAINGLEQQMDISPGPHDA